MTGEHLTHSPAETRSLGGRFVRALRPGEVVLLCGDLGAGKTCFVQGMLEGLGFEEAATSPTYTYVREHSTSPPLAHADLYRMESPEAIHSLGLEECMESGMLLAVEWGERAADFWPPDAWRVELTLVPGDDQSRLVRVKRGDAS